MQLTIETNTTVVKVRNTLDKTWAITTMTTITTITSLVDTSRHQQTLTTMTAMTTETAISIQIQIKSDLVIQ